MSAIAPEADPDAPTGPALLAVFAHPDDEEFGTAGALILCADRGVHVQVVSATRGDAGEISDPALATRDNLGDVREEELREACRILGIADPMFFDYGDGQVAAADPDELVRRIVAAIRSVRPRVVVTFDANGGYGHADHIAVHHATVAAFERSSDPTFAPELGLPHRPDKLYATAFPRSRFSVMSAEMERFGVPGIDFGDVRTIELDEVGTADDRITTAVPVDAVWDRRWGALRAHRTQFGADSSFLRLPEQVVRGWMATDMFVRLVPPPPPGATLPDEDDLWAGLPLPSTKE
jgi:LmbE family N-acetylglucosaminyl deacetylase